MKTGKPGALLGTRLDLLVSVGPAGLWRQGRARAGVGHQLDPLDALYRSIWTDAAEELGASLAEIGAGFLRISRASSSTLVWRQMVQLDDAVTLRMAADKVVTHRLLRAAGLAVPEHVVFPAGDLAPARVFMAEAAGPFVVKPVFGTDRGTGVTSGVRTAEDLRRARLRAARWDDRLLIERQVAGAVYRLLYLDGRLLGAVRRGPPTVTGDGAATVGGLVADENRRRVAQMGTQGAGLTLLDVDLDCLLALAAAGLTLRSRPPRGQTVTVKAVVNQNRPEDNVTATDAISTALAAEAASAAAACGLRLAGVDLITPDPSRSLAVSGGVVLEVNGTPGFNLHYLVADEAAVARVAVPVLGALLGEVG